MIVNSVSVLICTFNRAPRLARTLESFRRTATDRDYRMEVIVVDNNSTDTTATVVADAGRGSTVPIRYDVERQQGKGFALNRGLTLSEGDIIALTDDDVDPAPDWLDRIVHLFRTYDVVFVGGKILPNWEVPPPAWLTTHRARDIWGPLALSDFGDELFVYRDNPQAPHRPIGANMAVRRAALQRVGGWRTDLGKVNNTLIPGEDHEIYFRLHAAGEYRGLYDPQLVVHHDVPSSRLHYRYFVRWFFAAGQAHARMAKELYPGIDFDQAPALAGVPRFFYRELAQRALHLLRTAAGDRVMWRVRLMQMIRLIGLMWECSGSRPSAARSSGNAKIQ
jgi:cellulose synthase/poly-beta-1,6-N-acetylglucosamine synthase-like glycosyltransferase